MIQTEKLGKTYQGKPVLRGLDLIVQPGEFVVLQGANGAGKTTLLRILSTLTRPTTGDCTINGFSVKKQPEEVRKRIGVMLHEPMLYGDLTALENLGFYAALAGLKQRREISERLLDQVALDPGSSKKVRSYSRGMLQRLSLARALIANPPVLLLDEPFTGLDAESQVRLLHMLKEASRDGKALLVTDHDAVRSAGMASRVDYLHSGGIVRSFSGAELDPAALQREISLIENGPEKQA